MKTTQIRKSPIALVMIGLLLTSFSSMADNPNVWGRWGAGGDVAAVVDVGGSLEIGEISDPSLFNPGLNNLNLPDGSDPVPANPGDWVMYGIMTVFTSEDMGSVYIEDGPFGMGARTAVTEGTLLLRPPVDEGVDGQLGFNIARFIESSGPTGGQEILFPVAVLAGGPDFKPPFFPDAPEFVPFSGQGEAVANVPGFDGGNGFINGQQLFDFGPEPGEENGPVQALFEPEPPEQIDFLSGGNFDFNVQIDQGPGGFNGSVSGNGAFFAGQPTADISGLQAGNVIAQYSGSSGLGFAVSATMNFAPATFSAEFNDGGFLGAFGVTGSINGSSFTSNTFAPGRRGQVGEVTGATVDGTLFGPNAEALGGLVTFDATFGEDTLSSGADVFVAVQQGVQLPSLRVPR